MSSIQSLYNAIIVRGTRSVPTYQEVQEDARHEAARRISAQISF